MENISSTFSGRNVNTSIPSIQEYLEEALKESSTPPARLNGSAIAIIAAVIPVLILILLILSIKISERVCPEGRRPVLSIPRRISTMSVLSTTFSRSSFSSMNDHHHEQSSSTGRLAHSPHHHGPGHGHSHGHGQQHHHGHHGIGRPLLIELETIKEPEVEEDEEAMIEE